MLPSVLREKGENPSLMSAPPGLASRKATMPGNTRKLRLIWPPSPCGRLGTGFATARAEMGKNSRHTLKSEEQPFSCLTTRNTEHGIPSWAFPGQRRRLRPNNTTVWKRGTRQRGFLRDGLDQTPAFVLQSLGTRCNQNHGHSSAPMPRPAPRCRFCADLLDTKGTTLTANVTARVTSPACTVQQGISTSRGAALELPGDFVLMSTSPTQKTEWGICLRRRGRGAAGQVWRPWPVDPDQFAPLPP